MFMPAKIDNYAAKKRFLDHLEDANGNVERACETMHIDQDFIERLKDNDLLFATAILQIQDEIALDQSGLGLTSSQIGTRPFDLINAVNVRLSQDDTQQGGEISTSPMRLETAMKMCLFLRCFRDVSWDTREACRASRVSAQTLLRWKKSYPEFLDLFRIAEIESIDEIYSAAKKRALDPTASGDVMRAFILKHRGDIIGLSGMAPKRSQPTQTNVQVNIQNTPQQSDAIVRAHEKAIESSLGVISIPKKASNNG